MAKKPVSKSKKPKQRLARVDEDKALQPDEVERLRAWAKAVLGRSGGDPLDVRNAVVVLVLLGTGARRFELCAFTCASIIRRPHGGPVCIYTEAKGNKTAEIPISDETMRIVEWWLAWKRANGEPTAKDAPLFQGRAGEHMSRGTLHNLWKVALAAAGVSTDYGVHASRHAAGMLLLRQTQSLALVGEFLRHSNTRITERFYKHVLDSDIRTGLDKAGL